MKKPPRSASRPVTTRSGKVLKVNRSLGERYNAMRQAKALRKVNRLRGLPKSRLMRFAWRLQPKRLAEYWFSRDGGIMALKVIGITIAVLFLLTLGVFAYFRKDLKSVDDVSGSALGGSISYYDRTGQTLLWQDYNAVKRVPVASDQISPYMKQAIVAVEDKDFYKHRGFDLKSIFRAAYVDVLHRGNTQGGSTITEQLVKLTRDFNQNRTLTLKVKELILAVELERTYTKDQILTDYLNVAPFGSVDYGVQTAASDYFHESAKDLTLPQAAFLAAIPNSPSYFSKYSPYFDQQAFLARDHYILDLMVQQNMITQKQANAAKKVDVLATVQPQPSYYAGIQAPYFVLSARDELTRRFVPSNGNGSAKIGGWKIITTLDLNIQHQAEHVVASNTANAAHYGADEEAVVAEDVKTGQMLASVGGEDFNDANHGQLNFAHSVKISPGSSFKPYDYVTLIDNNTNVGAGSVLYDSQSPLPGYSCTDHGLPPPRGNGNCLEDYDFKYPGAESLRYALGGSRNVPAVKAMLEAVPTDRSASRTTSINKVISTADALMDAPNAYQCYNQGVDVNNAKTADQTQCYGASAIGDGAYLHLDQHINGVASLARMGSAIPNTYILKINDASNKTIYQFKQPKGTQVVRQDAAYIVDSMTSDPNASYLPSGYYKWHRYGGWQTSIKTGTTGLSFDGLEMSWNTQYAVGSWVGYHNRNKALAGTMELMTTPLTRGLMTYMIDNSHLPPQTYSQPSDIKTMPAYVLNHKISSNGEIPPSPSMDIYPAWYIPKSGSSAAVTIDRVSNNLATNCTPPLAKETLGGSAAPNAFSIDQFYPPGQTASASSGNTGATDNVHQCSDSPPTINLTATPDTVDPNKYTITAFVSAGTHPLNDATYPQFPGTITFTLNGATINTQGVTDPQDNITFTYDATASGTLTATVTDSVLYSASATAPINFTPAAVGPQAVTATITGTNVKVSWSGGTGPSFTITDSNSNLNQTCSSSPCNVPLAKAPLNSTITVTDSNNQSGQAQVKT
ncbi:MAG TPA: transglycosylase domain-containing protein [Candidatus Saccharimonadales bacterium]|nr:transglycosylase domain-containing protein [Candidatus Saccharimonadales bacterium]